MGVEKPCWTWTSGNTNLASAVFSCLYLTFDGSQGLNTAFSHLSFNNQDSALFASLLASNKHVSLICPVEFELLYYSIPSLTYQMVWLPKMYTLSYHTCASNLHWHYGWGCIEPNATKPVSMPESSASALLLNDFEIMAVTGIHVTMMIPQLDLVSWISSEGMIQIKHDTINLQLA